MLIACLPWYDLAETQDTTDRLWNHIAADLRQRGIEGVPKSLDRRADYRSQWQDPMLLLGQACGYDVYCANDHDLQVVAVPRYSMQGCEDTRYRSFVMVRDDSNYESLEDLVGARCVINSPRSHSGMNVLQSMVAPLSCNGTYFESVSVSGAHEESLAMIREDHADVAAIDCITYGLLKKHRPEALSTMRIVHQTTALTAPPYVTGARTDPAMLPILREAIATAITALDTQQRFDLGLLGVERVELADYQGVEELRKDAQHLGYNELSKF